MDTLHVTSDIHWLGDSLDVVRGYSDRVRRAIGSELRLLQCGERPLHARSHATIGRGVWELKVSDAGSQFRVVYIVKRNDRIYVLHAFQKRTQRTPLRDIELARARLMAI